MEKHQRDQLQIKYQTNLKNQPPNHQLNPHNSSTIPQQSPLPARRMPAAGMTQRHRKARATALWGQGLPQQNHRIACPIQQPLRGAQAQRADTRVEGGRITLYGYDSRNRLNEVRDGSNSNLIARYGYDPQNRRIWKEQYRDRDGTALTQAKRTDYLSADEGLIAEAMQAIVLNADETVTANGSPAIVAQYGPRPDNPNLTATLFIKTRNSNNLDIFAYYHHDHLGTPVQATDKQGNVVWAASYHAFGLASIITPAATPDIPTITSNLRLPGQYADEETGLYYNLNRYYDPATGNYRTRDPIGLRGGVYQYAYSEGDPLNYIDPTGEELVGALIGMGFEIAKQSYKNYRNGCSLTSLSNYDLLDIAEAGVFGLVMPGLGKGLKGLYPSWVPFLGKSRGAGGAIRGLSKQATNTANRAMKIDQRIAEHYDDISYNLVLQSGYQTAKTVAQSLNGDGTCGCKK